MHLKTFPRSLKEFGHCMHRCPSKRAKNDGIHGQTIFWSLKNASPLFPLKHEDRDSPAQVLVAMFRLFGPSGRNVAGV